MSRFSIKDTYILSGVILKWNIDFTLNYYWLWVITNTLIFSKNVFGTEDSAKLICLLRMKNVTSKHSMPIIFYSMVKKNIWRMLIIKHWLFLFICLSLTYYSVRNENIQTRKVQEEKYRLESSQQLHCWYLQIMKYWNQCVSLCEILIPFWCHRN